MTQTETTPAVWQIRESEVSAVVAKALGRYITQEDAKHLTLEECHERGLLIHITHPTLADAVNFIQETQCTDGTTFLEPCEFDPAHNLAQAWRYLAPEIKRLHMEKRGDDNVGVLLKGSDVEAARGLCKLFLELTDSTHRRVEIMAD